MSYSPPYSVILADPPWTYRDKARSGQRGVAFKYPTMSLDDIQQLPVGSIAADDSVLFCWVTFPLLKEGIATMEAWGFSYKTLGFCWVKLNPKAGTPFWGMGNFTRANPEICLLGVKGKPKRVHADVHSLVSSPIQVHSKKPTEVHRRIDRLMGDVPRIELFAREAVDGWDAAGHGIDGRDMHDVLTDMI